MVIVELPGFEETWQNPPGVKASYPDGRSLSDETPISAG